MYGKAENKGLNPKSGPSKLGVNEIRRQRTPVTPLIFTKEAVSY